VGEPGPLLTDHPGPVVTTSDGARLQTYALGEGPSVVLIHGATGSVPDWDDVVAELAPDGVRIVAYYHRGHGTSTVGRDGFDIARYGQDLAEVLEALDLRDAVLVGHSMGGMAVLAYLTDPSSGWRGRVRGASLVSTSATGLGGSLQYRLLTPILRAGLVHAIVRRPRLGRAFLRPMFGRGAPDEMVERARRLNAATPSVAARNAPISVLDFDLTAHLAGIDLPAEVVVGGKDRATPVASARRLAELLPLAHLRVLPDAGHFLNLEAPEVIAESIRALLPD
jgi:pimeloyl-ACP methyl ester carboxylesterase